MKSLKTPYHTDSQGPIQPTEYYNPITIEDEHEVYVAHPKTVHAVNLAVRLGVPLLVTGEAGIGKTQLAKSVAGRLQHNGKPWGFLRYQVRSDSDARDALYQFDAIRRLYDAQRDDSHVKNPNNYITWNALGKAMKRSLDQLCTVVLIDEIDKAPNDFPNGLLRELEEWEFEIPELKTPEASLEIYTVKLHKGLPRPFVIVTSNDERRLPNAFLRRCLVHEIPFPDEDALLRIVQAHMQLLGVDLRQQILELALKQFLKTRSRQYQLAKKPSIADLLMWVQALTLSDVTEEDLNRDLNDLKFPSLEALIKQRDDIKQLQGG